MDSAEILDCLSLTDTHRDTGQKGKQFWLAVMFWQGLQSGKQRAKEQPVVQLASEGQGLTCRR